jgi:hypothetical protein
MFFFLLLIGNDEGKSLVVMDFHRDVIDLFDDIRRHFLGATAACIPPFFKNRHLSATFCSSLPLILSMWRVASFSKYRLLMGRQQSEGPFYYRVLY